jgi:hypothetical protein
LQILYFSRRLYGKILTVSNTTIVCKFYILAEDFQTAIKFFKQQIEKLMQMQKLNGAQDLLFTRCIDSRA